MVLSLGGFESRPFIRGLQGRSVSMRAPGKPKDTLSKVLPLRWSLGSKDRRKPEPVPPPVREPGPVELVQYLESGRRPRCTKDPIVTLMSEPRGAKETEGQATNAANESCEVKTRVEPAQVPEGQRRPSEKTTSLKGSKASQAMDGSSTSISSSTLTRRKEGRKQGYTTTQDKDAGRSSAAGVQPSSSTTSLRDGTLRRHKAERADRERHSSNHEGKANAKKGESPKSHEGLFSFFKGKKKKENEPKTSGEGESGTVKAEEETTRNLSRLSLSNGAATQGTAAKEGRSSEQRQPDDMANGKVAQRTSAIKRSQSSSNIPTKAEHGMHRTASLHRNGMSAATPRSLTTDKPSYGTLQRTRYSTTSLGRKRTVPESSFWRLWRARNTKVEIRCALKDAPNALFTHATKSLGWVLDKMSQLSCKVARTLSKVASLLGRHWKGEKKILCFWSFVPFSQFCWNCRSLFS